MLDITPTEGVIQRMDDINDALEIVPTERTMKKMADKAIGEYKDAFRDVCGPRQPLTHSDGGGHHR